MSVPETTTIYCQGANSKGRPCRRMAVHPRTYCHFHDPAREEERTTGLRRTPAPEPPKSAPLRTEPFSLESAAEIQQLLIAVANHLATSENPDIPRAHALTSVAGVLLKTLRLRKHEERIEDLEQDLEDRFRDLADYRRALEEERRLTERYREADQQLRRENEALRRVLLHAGLDPDQQFAIESFQSSICNPSDDDDPPSPRGTSPAAAGRPSAPSTPSTESTPSTRSTPQPPNLPTPQRPAVRVPDHLRSDPPPPPVFTTADYQEIEEDSSLGRSLLAMFPHLRGGRT